MTPGYLNGDNTVTKANQIIALSKLASEHALETPSAEVTPFNYSDIFDVIRRLAYEISDEVEEIEREHKIGSIWGTSAGKDGSPAA